VVVVASALVVLHATILALDAVPAYAAPPGAGPSSPRAPAPATAVLLLPTSAAIPELDDVARELDALLADTAKDLGLALAARPAGGASSPPDDALPALATAARAAVVRATLVPIAGTEDIELRMVLASPGKPGIETRAERRTRSEVSLLAVVQLRDLVAHGQRAGTAPPPGHDAAERLAGRVTLMANATALGGLVGFSIQRGSGSTDPKLTVPLTLVGAGIGLGASYLASGEWDVGTGDAWYFAAGSWWGTASGHLIFQGRFAATRTDSDRWVFGVVGGGLGATLSTLGLALHPMSDAGAIVASGGGAVGLGIGALAEIAARRSASQVPYSGMGYGAGLGWLAAAAVAVQLRTPWHPSAHATALASLPTLGVIGESRAGARSEPIYGVAYSARLDALMRPFPR
jgi:hypothetical protein